MIDPGDGGEECRPYELLTGKRLLDGEKVTQTLADVVGALPGMPIKHRLEYIGACAIARRRRAGLVREEWPKGR